MNYFKLLYFVILLSASSCSLTYRVLLGVDSTPNWTSEDELVHQASKYNIRSEQIVLLDTASYFEDIALMNEKIIQTIEKTDSLALNLQKRVYKDDYQAVQFRLFNNQGKELFKLVNCYVDPPIPMNWNVQNCFDTFPFQISYNSLNVHHFNLQYILDRTRTLNNEPVKFNELPTSEYYAVIFWNNILKRPSKKLIKQARKKIDQTGENIHVIYVNNHNAVIWNALDNETKSTILQQQIN